MAEVTTLSLFRFDGLVDRAFAFSQMGLARARLPRTPGLRFHKLLGSGAGAGFSTKPDLSRYGLLCVWDDREAAIAGTRHGPVHDRWRARSVADVTLHLQPTRSRGQWDGQEPFHVDPATEADGPIVALTRATLRWSAMIPFWSLVPAISDAAEEDEHRHFMAGLGEVPWKHQMTFSIWDDEAAMRDFSMTSPTHGVAVRRAWEEGWFAESLFARFNLLAVEGIWPGLERFAGLHDEGLGGHAGKASPHMGADASRPEAA